MNREEAEALKNPTAAASAQQLVNLGIQRSEDEPEPDEPESNEDKKE